MKKVELKNSLCVLIETGIKPVAIITSKNQKEIYRLSGHEEFNYFVKEYSLTIEEFKPEDESLLDVFQKIIVDNTLLCYQLWNYSAFQKAQKREEIETSLTVFQFAGETQYVKTRHSIRLEFVFGYTSNGVDEATDDMVYLNFELFKV